MNFSDYRLQFVHCPDEAGFRGPGVHRDDHAEGRGGRNRIGGVELTKANEPGEEIQALRERLSKLSEASLYISESLVVRFSNEDEGYETWLSENPAGFVFNHFQGPNRDFNVLHRASCGHLHRSDPRQEFHTTVEKCVSVRLDRWPHTRIGSAGATGGGGVRFAFPKM